MLQSGGTSSDWGNWVPKTHNFIYKGKLNTSSEGEFQLHVKNCPSELALKIPELRQTPPSKDESLREGARFFVNQNQICISEKYKEQFFSIAIFTASLKLKTITV